MAKTTKESPLGGAQEKTKRSETKNPSLGGLKHLGVSVLGNLESTNDIIPNYR